MLLIQTEFKVVDHTRKRRISALKRSKIDFKFNWNTVRYSTVTCGLPLMNEPLSQFVQAAAQVGHVKSFKVNLQIDVENLLFERER